MNVNGLSGGSDILKTMIQKRGQNRSDKVATFQENSSINDTYSGPYTLRMGGLVSRALDKGANVTIYKSDSYTTSNPILRVVTTSADGKENEQLIDPREVDITNATQNEMLALNAYLVDQGKLDNSVYATSIMQGSSVSDVDLSSASNLKKNFLDVAKEMMEMQYKVHNFAMYAEYRKIFGVYNSFMGIK